MPADIGTHLQNVLPQIHYSVISDAPSPLTLDNLDKLNDLGGRNVTLQSIEDPYSVPSWIKGTKPDVYGRTVNATTAAVIVVEKGDGIVDAFYMYFYSYNYGGEVLGMNFGTLSLPLA
jgi:hypothetical protein